MNAVRADAQRNYARLLAVAEEEIALNGADASLEQIARLAGVGSGTVRRHFPTATPCWPRVFRERVESLSRPRRRPDRPPRRPGRPAGVADRRHHLGRDHPRPGRGPEPRLRLGAGGAHEHCATSRLTEAA